MSAHGTPAPSNCCNREMANPPSAREGVGANSSGATARAPETTTALTLAKAPTLPL